MTKTQAKQIEAMIVGMKDKPDFGPPAMFLAIRSTPWGQRLSSHDLVDWYNRVLGQMFGRGTLTFEEVNKAMGR